MRTLLITSTLALLATACTESTPGNQQARVRNEPPVTCGADDFEACDPAVPSECPPGFEAVLDYSSDCCAHFSCQPICAAAPEECNVGPAPVCPPGTQLWIGTAIEDCCPAYRCEPTTECEGVREDCALGMPYCGDGVEPILVGMTDGCCPIWQCPCAEPVPLPDGGGRDPGAPAYAPDPYCGCTYPVCGPYEQLMCMGDNICGYPCECVPVTGGCQADVECGPDMFCDLSRCLPAPGCDPAAGTDCADVCYGFCTGRVENGCASDVECPTGQHCELACAGWACVPGPGGEPCTCPADDPTCTCTPDGGCTSSGSCVGICLPDLPTCDPSVPPAVECPIYEQVPCENPETIVDPYTCCPMPVCPRCDSDIMAPCAMPDCAGAVQIGTDPACCPIYCCPDETGTCVGPDGSVISSGGR